MNQYNCSLKEISRKVSEYNCDLVTLCGCLDHIYHDMREADPEDSQPCVIKTQQLLLERITADIESFCRELENKEKKKTRITFDADNEGNEIVIVKHFSGKEERYIKASGKA